MASAWSTAEPIAASYVDTASAVLVAGRERAEDALVATQGHVITVDALFRTLAVEATVHHLDLRLGKPSEAGLAVTRREPDGLLGQPGPIADASRYALIGTGREPLTDEESAALGTAPTPVRMRIPCGITTASPSFCSGGHRMRFLSRETAM